MKNKTTLKRSLPPILALVIFATSTFSQSVVIDNFSTNQPLFFAIGAGSSTSLATVGTGIIGGERDMELTVVAGAVVSGEVAAGTFNFSVAAATSGECLLMYDGSDGLPKAADLDPTGLGGVDLTSGGNQNALLVRYTNADQPGTLIVTVYSDGANFSTYTQAVPVTAVSTEFILPFSGFTIAGGTGADFADVGAITIFQSGFEIDAGINLIATTSLLTATMTDALLTEIYANGFADPGETIRYTVVVSNPDDGADVAATGIEFVESAVTNGTLIVGSVTTSQGTVTTGNTAGDTGVGVDVGTIADGGIVTITFDLVISNPPSSNNLSVQGTVNSDMGSIVTDDPDDPTSDTDPTITPISVPVGFAKVFAPDAISQGGISTLTFTIDNTANGVAATSLDFTDNLPASVVVATPANALTTCTGGTLTATSGTGTISYTGGSVAAGASCTVQVDVTSNFVGMHLNTTGDLTSSNGNSGTASDTLTVNPAPVLVPTLGEWGLIILTLLLLNFGLFAMSTPKMQTANGWNLIKGFQFLQLPFDVKLFPKSLIVVALAVVVIFMVAIVLYGYQMTSADPFGAMIAIPLLAYLMMQMGSAEKGK